MHVDPVAQGRGRSRAPGRCPVRDRDRQVGDGGRVVRRRRAAQAARAGRRDRAGQHGLCLHRPARRSPARGTLAGGCTRLWVRSRDAVVRLPRAIAGPRPVGRRVETRSRTQPNALRTRRVPLVRRDSRCRAWYPHQPASEPAGKRPGDRYPVCGRDWPRRPGHSNAMFARPANDPRRLPHRPPRDQVPRRA